jgi:tetratricopeptide (TPR) repeat protein
MVVTPRWTGRETAALRRAHRMSIRAYAAHLGVSPAAVMNWERRGDQARLRTETQQILDTDLARASGDVQQRFAALLPAVQQHEHSATPLSEDHRPRWSPRRPLGAKTIEDPNRGGGASSRRIRADMTTSLSVGLATIRAALDAADLPPDGPIRPLPDLSAAVATMVRLRLTSNYLRLSAALPDLVHELHRARMVWVGQREEAASALLTQVYRAADALADKSGQHDLSARINEMMTRTAQQSGDELLLATASYVRGELFFANGRPDLGAALLDRAAERLVPDDDPRTSAAYGALHMRAAVLAGQAGQLDRARDHLAEAAEYARRIPDGEYDGTSFGPSSVRIHEVTLAVDTDNPDAALRAAGDWVPPGHLPGERRSHFYIDLARAHAQVGAFDGTIAALRRARATAPEHTRIHPQVHRVLADLIERRFGGDQVREYAQWAFAR